MSREIRSFDYLNAPYERVRAALTKNAPAVFRSVMKAELAIYPLTATETQLDFFGRYQPPLGWLGTAVDALAGHRIAEASVHRFVSEVAHYLRTELEGELRK
jgi:hypothetical protein